MTTEILGISRLFDDHFRHTIAAMCEGLSENKINAAKHMFAELRKNANADSNFVKMSFPIARRALDVLSIIDESQASKIATHLTNYTNQNVHRMIECDLLHGYTGGNPAPLDYQVELMAKMSEEFVRSVDLIGISD